MYNTSTLEGNDNFLFKSFIKISKGFRKDIFLFNHLTTLDGQTEYRLKKEKNLQNSNEDRGVASMFNIFKKPIDNIDINQIEPFYIGGNFLNTKKSSNPGIMTDLKKHKIFLETDQTREFKFFSRNWKNKLVESNPIGDVTIIKEIKSKLAFFIKGKTDLGIQIFLERKNTFKFSPKFPSLIQENLKFFPAKIVSIYPRIFFCRISLLPGRFTPLSSFKALKNLDNFVLNSEKKIQVSKLLSYLESLKNYQSLKNQNNQNFFLPNKFGEMFFWKIDSSFLKISLVTDPEEKKFFSFFY